MRTTPQHVTEQARAVARDYPAHRIGEGGAAFPRPRERIPDGASLDPHNAYGHFRISAPEIHKLVYGRNTVDLSDVEHLTEIAQTRAVGWGIEQAKGHMDGRATLREVAAQVGAEIRAQGLDCLDPKHTGHLAEFRELELVSALNRIRSLVVRQKG